MKKTLLTIVMGCMAVFALGQATVELTFEVNMNFQTVSSDGVFVAGGSGFGNPGDNQLTDPDQDGIYSITITKPANFSSYYIFLNGNCGDYSCKEQIGGQACSDPTSFNDRFVQLGTNDTTIGVCFGLCSDGTDCSTVDSASITYQVDMNNVTVDPAGVFIGGGAGFGGADGNLMSDTDGDGIYSVTIQKPIPFKSHYTILNGNCPDFSCKEDIAGQPCADPNNFNDRYIEIFGDTVVCTIFEQCVDVMPCMLASSIETLLDPNLFSVQPNLVHRTTTLVFSQLVAGTRQVEIINLSGQQVYQQAISGRTLRQQIELPTLPVGLYFVKVTQGNQVGIQKIQRLP
jgi:hypothetical protein